MLHFFLILLFLNHTFINATSQVKSNEMNSKSDIPTNELDLIFYHHLNKRENVVIIYFNISNFALHEYRYYYHDIRAFGYHSRSEYLPRQRFLDTNNSLRIVGLHEGDYVSCLSFIDEYENIFKPRYACYEFTLGEKTVGSHHGSKSGYLAPLLLAVAFVLHVFIAVVHHIKANNYAHKLLDRFINVNPKISARQKYIDNSIKELERELDQPHLSASFQRRLSRVAIDTNEDNHSNHRLNFLNNHSNDELPLYTLPFQTRRFSSNTMQIIPENERSNTLESISSMKHLIQSSPLTRHTNRLQSSSEKQNGHLNI